MKVFVAGATGAIGHPLVIRLLAERHEVFALTRSKERASEISALGATPLIADVFNEQSIFQGMREAEPEVVIDMLTSLPKEYTPQAMKEAAKRNTQIKVIGGGNVQKVAEQVGVKRYMVQSSAFWYTPGEGLADETTPFAFDATPGIAAGCLEYQNIEQRVLQSTKLEGVALRFGFFYGPGTWYHPGGSMARQVQQALYPLVDGGTGIWNFVHVEDAAQGIVTALTGSPGPINITGDDPYPLKEWLPAYAAFLGAPLPPKKSIEEVTQSHGSDFVYYATKLRGASNAKAKKALGFSPRPLEWMC